ncbi:MAG: AAA family ATPase [Myxococcota bacterium]
MYTAFYGLREKPFALSPNPRFLFLGEAHREALAHLLYGIEQGEGFIAITGEVGTGKTTLCRTLLERLGAETDVAFLFNPSRSGTELLQAISLELGLPAGGLTRRELGDQLNRHLLQRKREGRRVLLIVDEAQNLSSSTLEQIRLLSNLETSSEKLIQILLLGQPELDAKLDSPRLRQLRQRISVRWSLSPLGARDTQRYVRHRMQVAAGGRREVFTASALREVHRRTGGTPRLINILCDRALLLGYAEGAQEVDASTVRRAAREIPDARERGGLRRGLLWAAIGAAVAGAIALGVVGWREYGGALAGADTPAVASPPPAAEAAPAAKAPLPVVDPAPAADVSPAAGDAVLPADEVAPSTAVAEPPAADGAGVSPSGGASAEAPAGAREEGA